MKIIQTIVLSVGLLLTVSIVNAQDAFTMQTGQVTQPGAVGVNTCQDTDSCLRAIMQNTYETLQLVNTFPSYLQSFMEYLANLTKADESSATATLLPSFSAVNNVIIDNITGRNVNGQQSAINLLNNQPLDRRTFSTGDFTGDNPAINQVLPKSISINDITFSTVLGRPPIRGREDQVVSPENYFKNVSGINIRHTIPKDQWIGPLIDRERYKNYFSTVMAIESFNDVVMNSLFANTSTLTSSQAQLLTQVSNTDQWFLQISSEEIGKVIRQILLFESQNYVLLTQLVQTQKQLLAAQMMANTLTILNGQLTEGLLVSKAQTGGRGQP